MALKLNMLLEMQDKASKKLGKFENKVDSVKKGLKGLALQLGAAIGGAALIKSIVTTNMEFDKLEAQLGTFTNSAAEAAAAFNLIKEVTKKTPFQINEVTTAFTRMLGLGLTPSREALMAFGDVAAGTGLSILQFTEAVADAAMGEFERMKAFGIKMGKNGDKVTIKFKGMTQSVENDSGAIQDALVKLSQTNFGGAMERQMDTMEGAFSNLKDNWMLLARAIGQGGMNDSIKGIALFFRDMTQSVLDNMAKIKLAWVVIGHAIIRTGLEISYRVQQSFLGLELLFRSVTDAMMMAWNRFMSVIIKGINLLAKTGFIDEVSESFGQMGYIAGQTQKKLVDLTIAHKNNIKMLEQSTKTRAQNALAAKAAGMSVDEYEKKILAEAAARRKTAKAGKEQITVYSNIMKSMKQLRVDQDQAWDALTKIESAFQSGKLTADEYATAMKKINHILGVETADAAKKAEENVTLLAEHTRAAAESMQNSMSDFFFDALQGNITDLGASFKRVIDRMVADLLASKLFEMMLGDYGSTGSMGGFFGSMFGGARADGGPVNSGQAYLVGERGPEIMIPSGSGSIIPNETAFGGQVTFNVSAMDGQSVQRLFKENGKELAEAAMSATRTYNLR